MDTGTMTTHLPSDDSALTRSIRRVLGSPLQFQTYKNLLYIVLMFPLGIFYFNLIFAGLFIGMPLVLIGIGIPILLLLFVLTVKLATFERRLVNGLLDVAIPMTKSDTDGSLWVRSKRLVTATQTWKDGVYLISEFVYGTITFGLLASGIATSVSFLLTPTYYTKTPVSAYGPFPSSSFTLDILFGWDSLLVGLTTTFRLGSWRIDTLFGAVVVSALGAVLLWVTLLLSNYAAGLWGKYARRMLTSPR